MFQNHHANLSNFHSLNASYLIYKRKELVEVIHPSISVVIFSYLNGMISDIREKVL